MTLPALLGLLWPKPALAPATTAQHVARAVARFVAERDEVPAEVRVVVRGASPAVVNRIRSAGFDAAVAAELGPGMPRAYVLPGDGEPGLEVDTELGRPDPAWLGIEGAAYRTEDRRRVYVGRGPTRRLLTQHPNDIVIAEAHAFVHRDAFVLCWSPGRGWEISVDAEVREDVRIERAGVLVRLQATSLPLRDGDRILLLSARDPKAHLLCTFHLGEPG